MMKARSSGSGLAGGDNRQMVGAALDLSLGQVKELHAKVEVLLEEAGMQRLEQRTLERPVRSMSVGRDFDALPGDRHLRLADPRDDGRQHLGVTRVRLSWRVEVVAEPSFELCYVAKKRDPRLELLQPPGRVSGSVEGPGPQNPAITRVQDLHQLTTERPEHEASAEQLLETAALAGGKAAVQARLRALLQPATREEQLDVAGRSMQGVTPVGRRLGGCQQHPELNTCGANDDGLAKLGLHRLQLCRRFCDDRGRAPQTLLGHEAAEADGHRRHHRAEASADGGASALSRESLNRLQGLTASVIVRECQLRYGPKVLERSAVPSGGVDADLLTVDVERDRQERWISGRRDRPPGLRETIV